MSKRRIALMTGIRNYHYARSYGYEGVGAYAQMQADEQRRAQVYRDKPWHIAEILDDITRERDRAWAVLREHFDRDIAIETTEYLCRLGRGEYRAARRAGKDVERALYQTRRWWFGMVDLLREWAGLPRIQEIAA
jgi:hypothetical protein